MMEGNAACLRELAYSPRLSPPLPSAPSPPDMPPFVPFPSGYSEVLWPHGNMLLRGHQVPLAEVDPPGAGKVLSPEAGDAGCGSLWFPFVKEVATLIFRSRNFGIM